MFSHSSGSIFCPYIALDLVLSGVDFKLSLRPFENKLPMSKILKCINLSDIFDAVKRSLQLCVSTVALRGHY